MSGGRGWKLSRLNVSLGHNVYRPSASQGGVGCLLPRLSVDVEMLARPTDYYELEDGLRNYLPFLSVLTLKSSDSTLI